MLSDSEFNALISLLDDTDPSVEQHIYDRLLGMGPEIVPRLESAWERQEGAIQARIEEIIHEIQSLDSIRDLRSWFRNPEAELLEGWLLITRFHYPGLAMGKIRREIHRLSGRIWLEFTADMNAAARLTVINRMLYLRERFSANREDYYNPQNYYLNGFWETRRGGPLSMGMLYLILCRELEVPLTPILLPNYFTLLCEADNARFYIDPYNKGVFFLKEDLARYLKEAHAGEPDDYKPSSPRRIALQLIQHLLICHQRRKENSRASELTRLLKQIGEDFQE